MRRGSVAQRISGNHPDAANVTGWLDLGPVPNDATNLGSGAFVVDATIDQISTAIQRGDLDDETHSVLLSIRASLDPGSLCDCEQHCLRADSPGAPTTYGEAVARGPPWPEVISRRSSRTMMPTSRGSSLTAPMSLEAVGFMGL